ncbi:FkbM family methyltransferase [Nocardioides sp.]|uniref:FkbM family methyltransferase n=1 Tax=Nocardioides sp. TaxID=35761 RepID=UPI00272132A5|nr:FkbM family methyltransferase [Nocardioides sp.]MDO9454946.1 FkbM family methyltransferase [Nocardioides sp.]
MNRDALAGSLRVLRDIGFRPNVVIDVGAAFGTFALLETFPDAHHYLAEPLAEFEPALSEVSKSVERATLFIGVIGSDDQPTVLKVHRDLLGSSLLAESADDFGSVERTVDSIALDSLVTERTGQFLLKIDVQGAELTVLRGAKSVLESTAVAVIECSLFQFFQDGASITEIIDFMTDNQFSIYDIIESQYRPLDGALAQVDLVFVPTSSSLRNDVRYATPEQRKVQDKKFKKGIARFIS